MPSARPHVLIAGGGFVGLYAARTLEAELGPQEADLSLVSPENYMLYQPLLPEVASGTLEPRHAVVPLRRVLSRTNLVAGEVTGIDHDHRQAWVTPYGDRPYTQGYDHVVVGLGSVTRSLPVPGLEEHAVGFGTITDAIHLRNKVFSCMEAAAGTTDEDVRAKALTFVFVGGGYTGVEALAELEDMVRDACSLFPTIDRDEMRWVLVEASDRILANVAEPLQGHALELLRSRGIDVRLETTVDAVEGERIHLSDGDELDADTLVWAAGVQPNPLVAELGLPTDERGRLPVNAQLEVRGAPDAWAAGDNAAVPDLTSGGLCPPTAQHAEREARQLAANVAARVHRQPPAAFQYSMLGQMITLGRYKGVAELFGVRLRGFLPWFMRRTYYASRIPTLNRKLRLVTDWTVSLMFARDAVNLGSEQDPAPTLGSRRRTHPQLPPGRSEPSRPDPGRTESSGPDQNRTNDAETGAHRHG